MAAINDAVEALKAEVANLIPFVEAAKAERDTLKARISELEGQVAGSDPLVADLNAVTSNLAALRA
jgi:hypothetical protein